MSQPRFIGLAATALSLLAVLPAAAQEAPPEGTDFVYLNSADIIQSQPEFAEMTRTFDQEISDRRLELEEQAAAVDSLLREYQEQESVFSPQMREEKQQEIRTRQQALQNRRLEMENELNERQQELLRPILEEVGDAIETVRAERGYSMVFDISTEGVVAADPALDITELVRARVGEGVADTASSEP
ncbi:MAG: OmpH family outer membrane protein [Gemmatimonadota bacterium]